jgi:hypothetical protein
MSKLTIIIEDNGDEITVQGTVEPSLTADKTVYTTAEVIGLYMQQRQNMATIMSDAVKWAQEPDQPSLIAIPGGLV